MNIFDDTNHNGGMMEQGMGQEMRSKIGQLFMVGFDALEPDEHITRLILDQRIGGVILFRRNVHTPSQVSKLCRSLQEINARVSDQALLIALDQEGGMVMRIEQGVTPIPAAMAFQQAGSVADCESMNFISADEMRQLGINMLLAPVLDVNNNRLNPVIGVRAFGEDADTVVRYGMAALRGQKSAGVIVTAKHFPGHGDTATDTHYDTACVPHDLDRLRAVELRPFAAAIDQGVDAIMTAHVSFPAIESDTSVPATLSKAVLSGLLRGEMGYQGVIISDCLEMAAISEGIGIPAGAIATLQAGADIVLISHRQVQQHAAIDAVVQAVADGIVPRERIEEAAARVRKLKNADAVRGWETRGLAPAGLMKPGAMALSKQVQRAALRVEGAYRPLDRALPVTLITVEVRSRSEVDEVANGRNKDARSSMLPALLEAGLDVREFALSAEALAHEVDDAIAFAQGAAQVVVQTYNAMLVEGQRRLLAAMAPETLWVVAGRLPYDLDLAPAAQGRLAAYGCRPAALAPVVEKLTA